MDNDRIKVTHYCKPYKLNINRWTNYTYARKQGDADRKLYARQESRQVKARETSRAWGSGDVKLDANDGLGLDVLDLRRTSISPPVSTHRWDFVPTHLLCGKDITHRLHLDRLAQHRRSTRRSRSSRRASTHISGPRNEGITILALLVLRNHCRCRGSGLLLATEFHELTDTRAEPSVDFRVARGRCGGSLRGVERQEVVRMDIEGQRTWCFSSVMGVGISVMGVGISSGFAAGAGTGSMGGTWLQRRR